MDRSWSRIWSISGFGCVGVRRGRCLVIVWMMVCRCLGVVGCCSWVFVVSHCWCFLSCWVSRVRSFSREIW